MSKLDLAQQIDAIACQLELPDYEWFFDENDIKTLRLAAKTIQSIDGLVQENFELKRQNDFLDAAYRGCQKALTGWISGYHKLIKER